MILDNQEYFKTVTTGLNTIGGHTAFVSDYRDNQVAGAQDSDDKKYIAINGLTDLVRAAGAANLVITLVSDSAAAFNVAPVTHLTWTIAKADVAGYFDKKPLPEGMGRYVRIQSDVSVASDSGGTFSAFLANN